MVKKGDTLIEVLLAVGIFSMIAISVVAVMSGGTSSAQTALETTLAREEIDAQAEALRYIHDSYINDKNSDKSDLSTVALWRKIINQDNVYVPSGDKDDEELLKYNPTTCPTSASELPANAFILDTRALNLLGAAAYKSVKDDANVFAPATTFPRLIFGAGSENSLIEGDTSTALSRAEGIYIIAVADRDTTTVLDVDGNPVNNQGIEVFRPAFFDFYIRTCWYGTDAETASTISTVIRLHNPDVQTDYKYFNYSINGWSSDQTNYLVFKDDFRRSLYEQDNIEKYWPWKHTKGWSFDGWCLKENVIAIEDGGTACKGGAYQVGDSFSSEQGGNYEFVPVFSHIKYTIEFNTNGGSWLQGVSHKGKPRVCYEDVNNGECAVEYGDYNKCIANRNKNGDCDITRSGYAFKGWCDGSVSESTCNGKIYQSTSVLSMPNGFPTNRIVRLTAIWGEQNEKITIKLTWNSAVDYDSYISGTKDNGESFTAYYSNKKPTETVSGVTRVLAELDHDCTSYQSDVCKPSWNETFTVNTLGGKNYYYSVRNYSSDSAVSNATVTVSGDGWSRTFMSNNATGSGRVWNVFAYKNGQIVTPGPNGGTTRSATAKNNY